MKEYGLSVKWNSKVDLLTVEMGCYCGMFMIFFFFNDTATTEIYTLSLHDALPICCRNEKWAV